MFYSPSAVHTTLLRYIEQPTAGSFTELKIKDSGLPSSGLCWTPLLWLKTRTNCKRQVKGPEEGRKKPTGSITVRCSTCNGLHHNSVTCTCQGNKPSTKTQKNTAPSSGTGHKHRGRPRKHPLVTTVSQQSSISHLHLCLCLGTECSLLSFFSDFLQTI